ncbi:MAG TPA: MFS transporter [Candidatus Saccharimonadales bacterium]|nr:MFS transporter [Candidatus Saccharimonadales bacterium]
MCVPVFVGALDLTVVSAALPAIIFELGIPLQRGLGEASWIVSGYLLAYALGIVLFARGSDLVGRRTAFLVALVLFAIGSWLVATAREAPATLIADVVRTAGGRPDASESALYAVIIGRAVQGFAAGALVPVALALVGDLFAEGRRAFPLGVVVAIDTAGWVLGQLWGGVVVQLLPWQAIFWLNLPLTAVAFIAAWRWLPRPAQGGAHRPFDLPGGILLTIALTGLNVALSGNESGRAGLGVPDQAPAYVLPALVVAAAALAAFVARELRTPDPLIDLRPFAGRLSLAIAVNGLVGAALMVGLVSVPLLVNAAAFGAGPTAALVSGALLSSLTVPLAIAALGGGALVRRVGDRALAVAGLALAALGFALLTQIPPEAAREAVTGALGPEAVAMSVALLVAGVGLGLTVAPLATVVIDAAVPRDRGSAAAVVVAFRLIGMMVAVSALTTYGVRRWAALSPEAFAGIGTTDGQRIQGAVLALTSRITAEMAATAVGICVVAVLLALGLPPAREPAASPPGGA